MVIYETGAFFKNRPSTESDPDRDPKVFSMEIFLPPSPDFNGGQITLSHLSEKKTLEIGKDKVSCITCFASTKIDMDKIYSGHCFSIICDVYFNGNLQEIPHFQDYNLKELSQLWYNQTFIFSGLNSTQSSMVVRDSVEDFYVAVTKDFDGYDGKHLINKALELYKHKYFDTFLVELTVQTTEDGSTVEDIKVLKNYRGKTRLPPAVAHRIKELDPDNFLELENVWKLWEEDGADETLEEDDGIYKSLRKTKALVFFCTQMTLDLMTQELSSAEKVDLVEFAKELKKFYLYGGHWRSLE